MRCLMCEKLSYLHICLECQKNHLTPSIYKRKLDKHTEVISFYKYEEIKDLLHTKHTPLGFYIYSILAQNSFYKFAKNFNFSSTINSIAIDDKLSGGYSHTAILNKALSSKYISPLHSKLRARNSVNYSGKSKEFRLLNPRNFELKDIKYKDILLVDDIITTGSTLLEAKNTLAKKQNNILLCLTLADARGY
ncbi:MAG: phosphoribosyltransferase family protein [Sulfurimonadaceae bacterium]|nr:phosphoribosyltransferase family protein [Sulfurimonadaceae bacterium]